MEAFYFAVAGDVHGHHATLIERLNQVGRGLDGPLAFVLQVGDFEPIRDERDLETMPPHKHRRGIGDFHHVLSGALQYPAEVLFIGGNHEPYGWLNEFPEGGEVAPGICYVGRANVVERRGLRIAGLSGIHSPKRYEVPLVADWPSKKGRFKEPTYFRRPEVERLLAEAPVDVLMTHDWPQSYFGFFGNPQARALVEALRPQLHIAGHMHRATRQRVTHADGRKSLVVGLNHVGWGAGDVLMFRSTAGVVEEVNGKLEGRNQKVE